MKLKCGDSISRRSFLISASAMHLRDATELSERASERGLVGVRDPALLPYSLPLARWPTDSGRVRPCMLPSLRRPSSSHASTPTPSALLPPSFLRRPLDYGKRREGLRRTDGRGRSDGSRADRGADAECHAGGASLVPLFSGRQARSKETSRGRPRGARRGRPTVNSIPWAPAG